MSNRSDWKIYLTHERMTIMNEAGFKIELDVPPPENMVVCHVGTQTYYVGLFPPNPPRAPWHAPQASDTDSDTRPSYTPSSGRGDPEDPIVI